MDELLQEIETYIAARGVSAFRFGLLAANNGRLVERLREGRRVWPETAAAVRTYMADNPPEKQVAAE